MTRIGIVGCGATGREHASALSRIADVSLRVFCDVDAARADALCKAFGGTATTDPEGVFADPTVDAVYVCTHHDSHAALTVRAATTGKHVFLEKPVALTMAGCRRIRDAVARSGVCCAVGFKFRLQPAVLRARNAVPHPVLIVASGIDDRWPDDFWANDPVRGGGNVLSEGCHVTDLVRCFAGAEPVRVTAEAANVHHPGREIVDTLAATFRFANGVIASVTLGDCGVPPHVSKFAVHLHDGVRSAHLHDRLTAFDVREGGETRTHRDAAEIGLAELDRAFVESVRSGAEPPVTLEDGIAATAMTLAALEAARSGAAVAMDDIR